MGREKIVDDGKPKGRINVYIVFDALKQAEEEGVISTKQRGELLDIIIDLMLRELKELTELYRNDNYKR